MKERDPSPSLRTKPPPMLDDKQQKTQAIATCVLSLMIICWVGALIVQALDFLGMYVVLASIAGGIFSVMGRMLDHSQLTLNEHARRDTELSSRAYVALRLALGCSFGGVAAYMTFATQASLETAHHAPMLPVVAAFIGGYLFKAPPTHLR